jgi:pimeloyl-ACP methyl ester carboxylesterase
MANWYWPDNAAARWPCVVLANGFSGTRDWILPDFAQRFADAGVAALTFDYRHLGESGGTPRQIVKVREQRADLLAALVHARREPRIDPRRVALWGTSLGGSHALAVAAEDRDIAALILNMPAIDAVSGGANIEAKRKRVGMSRARTVAITIRLLSVALRDLWRATRGAEPVYLAVYGEPGRAFLTDPELAPRFRRVAEGSPTWQNRIAARFLLGAPRYNEGTFERVAAPILICLAQYDVEISADFVRTKAARAARAEIRVYPFGHFDMYHDDAFAQVVEDQVAFLCTHLGVERGNR